MFEGKYDFHKKIDMDGSINICTRYLCNKHLNLSWILTEIDQPTGTLKLYMDTTYASPIPLM